MLVHRLARGRDFWVGEQGLEARPLGEPRDFCNDGRPRFSKKYGGRVGVLFEQIQSEQLDATASLGTSPPPRYATPSRERSSTAGQSPRIARRTVDAAAAVYVPPMRRRRRCPPQLRVRNSPRVHAPVPEPIWAFSLEGGRAHPTLQQTRPSPHRAAPTKSVKLLTPDEDEASQQQQQQQQSAASAEADA